MEHVRAETSVDELPVGVVRLDESGHIVETNPAFKEWAGGENRPGVLLEQIVEPLDDFLEAPEGPSQLYALSAAPDRAAFLVRRPIASGSIVTVMDASNRLAAGRRLRASLALADRTRRRLELLLDASVRFSTAATVEQLAEVLSATAASAFAAEHAAVYLFDAERRLVFTAGSDPTRSLIDPALLSRSVTEWPGVVKVTSTTDADIVTPGFGAAMESAGVHAAIGSRIRFGHAISGMFLCYFQHPRHFDDEADPLAEALAGQAGQALSTVRLQQQLAHAALHDEITGLPNRRMLEETSSALGASCRVAILFLDLDGFKLVNDRLGHDRGDSVLKEVASRLRAHTRESDTVVRYGGDEFVVIAEIAAEGDAEILAERLRCAMEEPIAALPAGLALSASIGLALTPPSGAGVSIDTMIRAADQAMYRAKGLGGNRIEFDAHG